MPATSPAEWGEAVSVALMLSGTTAGLFHLTVDADPADFDPRPAIHRAIESGRLDPALIAVVNARHAARDAAITAAALLMLLTSKEATR